MQIKYNNKYIRNCIQIPIKIQLHDIVLALHLQMQTSLTEKQCGNERQVIRGEYLQGSDVTLFEEPH